MLKKKRLTELLRVSLLAAFICVCSQIQIPFTIPITLQTFAIFTALMMLPAFDGAICVLLYIAIGLVGLPVFAGFSGGVGHIASPAGGYIIGFAAAAIVYPVLRMIFGDGVRLRLLYGGICHFVIYLIAAGWIGFVYTPEGADGFLSALAFYVLPFVIPDGIKLFSAYLLSKKFARGE